MDSTFYFVCTVKFSCRFCRRASVEELIAEGQKFDPNAVRVGLMKQRFKCQHCLKPIADGTIVDIHAEPASPEQLKARGFSPPRPN